MKRIVILGATSGIGLEVARIYTEAGWRVGAAARRKEKLEQLHSTAPEQIAIEEIDVTCNDAVERLHALIEKLGGMDIFLLSSGIGYQNLALDVELEQQTVNTNAGGFTRMVTAAYHYFQKQGGGHIAVISSIAGTKGLGAAPAYSATKLYQNTYIDALAQLSRMQKTSIAFTDIRPGFVRTDLLKEDTYPLQMSAEKVARKIVHALQCKKRRVVIDWRYAVIVFFWKLIPAWLWERLPIHS